MLVRLDRLLEPIVTLPRLVKRAIVLGTDVALCFFTVWIAYYLRLNDWVSLWNRGWPAAILSLTAVPVFSAFGLYRSVLRHMGSHAFMVIGQAVVSYGLLFSAVVMTFGIPGVPRTIGIIQPLLMLVAVIASRIGARYWLGQGYRRHVRRDDRRKVVIYGAGSAGRQLANALETSSQVQLVGFIDDDRNLQGGVVCGVRIWKADELAALIRIRQVQEILLAMPSASRQRRAEILSVIQSLGIAVRTLPDLLDIAHGKVAVDDLRPVEIEDLLGRDSVAPDARLLAHKVRGHRIMVTGAGGSIGSELCRQIAEIGPSVLLLIEASEYALYAIHRELGERGHAADIEIVPLIGSVCDEARMDEIVASWRPDTIYHAAAYKHVPLVEHNVLEGVRNNALGTWTLARVARRHRIASFILVSTDKAVRPTNVMGASKRLAEMILQALAEDGEGTCFAMVRFGNVLGSSGSVVPLFRAQIAAGGPITVTHPDITRYFMTIPEASQLVIQAGAMARGGEVFVLDMGEPIRIYDLAVRMVELSGLHLVQAPGQAGDIGVEFTGLRPGEKLYEELLIGDNPAPTQHPRIMTANETFLPWPELQARLKQMQVAIAARDVLLTRHLLADLVTDYRPAAEVVDWVNGRAPATDDPGARHRTQH